MIVRWTGVALDKLARFYVTLPLAEQREVSAAVATINLQLSLRPTELGESREAGNRVWFAGRFMIKFALDTLRDEVKVFDISRLGSRPN